MAGSLGQPTHGTTAVSEAGAGAAMWRTRDQAEVVGAYANLADLFTYSIPEDARHDFRTSVLLAFLTVGAARINEVLGQRFDVPLRVWSATVVWANCELAFIGAVRQRGVNTEADALNLRDREAAVKAWLDAARDHEITPDPRLSDGDRSVAMCYVSDGSRGWDKIGVRGRR